MALRLRLSDEADATEPSTVPSRIGGRRESSGSAVRLKLLGASDAAAMTELGWKARADAGQEHPTLAPIARDGVFGLNA